jgi:hypothetical protein
MPTILKAREGNRVTLEVSIDLADSMLTDEEAIQEAIKLARLKAAEIAQQSTNTDVCTDEAPRQTPTTKKHL